MTTEGIIFGSLFILAGICFIWLGITVALYYTGY